MLKMKNEKKNRAVQCTMHIYLFHSWAQIQLNQRMLCHEMYLYGRCTYCEWIDVIVFRDVQSQLKKNQRTTTGKIRKKDPTTTQSIHVSINSLVCISLVAFVYGQMFWCIFQASFWASQQASILTLFFALSNLASEQFSAFLQAIEFMAHDEDMRTNNIKRM